MQQTDQQSVHNSPTIVMSHMSMMATQEKDLFLLKAPVRSHKQELQNSTMRAHNIGKKQATMEAYTPKATSTAVDQALGETFFCVEHSPKQGQLTFVLKSN